MHKNKKFDLIKSNGKSKEENEIEENPAQRHKLKRVKRITEHRIRIVHREVVKIVGIPNNFAVDSTGIQISYRSYYYTQRIGELRKIRGGLKLHAAVDIDSKLITNAIVTKWHANDSPYLIPLLKNGEKIEEDY